MRAGMKILKWGAVCAVVLGSVAANDVAPTNAELEAMYDKAFRAFDSANYVQALKELDGIDARKPDLVESQNLRGVIYMRQGIYDKAEAALSEAERLNPKFWNARFNLAEIPFLKKDWVEARKRFQELLTSNASELQGDATQLIQYKILLTYLLEGNDTMVDSILAKFELSPGTPAVHYANAAIALQHQNIPESKNWIAAAEKNFSPQLNKLFAESLFEVGWLQKQSGQQRASLQLLTPEERAAQTKTMLRSQFEQAQQAYEQRDFATAASLAEQADAGEPNQAPILNLRGEILLEEQKFDDAESFFKKALKVDPKFREAQFNLADVPFRKKEYAKARDRFEALFKQIPGGEKNQAAQLIRFKIYMTHLLEGKDSRAQKMMEQFQFSGDTPALYYAQAAWEFQHGNADKANDWITSARKIYPLAANAAYGSGFYDLGWLKSAAIASSPSPSAAVDAAAIASAQNESPAPAVEPSPIPGVETKLAEEGSTQFSVAQAAPLSSALQATTGSPPAAGVPARPQEAPVGRSAVPGGLTAPSATPATAQVASEPQVTLAPPVSAQSSTEPAGSDLAIGTLPSPALSAGPPAVATNKPPTEQPPPAAPSVSPTGSAAPAVASKPVLAPSTGQRLDRITDPRTLLWVALLLGGIGALGWAVLPSIRRRISDGQLGNRPAPATGPQISDSEEPESAGLVRLPRQFAGGPRQVSVQLKASEPSLRRGVMPLSKRAAETPVVTEPVPAADFGNGHAIESDFNEFSDSCVGPVIEQVPEAAPATRVPELTVSARQLESVAEVIVDEPTIQETANETAGLVTEEPTEMLEPTLAQPVFAEEEVQLAPEETAAGEPMPFEPTAVESEMSSPADNLEMATEAVEPLVATAAVEAEIPSLAVESEMVSAAAEPEMLAAAVEPELAAAPVEPMEATIAFEPVITVPEETTVWQHWEQTAAIAEPEPVLQGQPVPYQTVVEFEQPVYGETAPAHFESDLAQGGAEDNLTSAVGATAITLFEPVPAQDHFISQPITTENMPETLQTPTAPVIRTSAGGPAPQPVHAAAAANQPSPTGGMHTAVQITLSCEIASMQLTPTFKMGALQLRPVSKVVTMRLAPSQQPQPAMNLQVNFELAKVQPASNSLGQIRLNPSQQQKPAMLASPTFSIAGLQIVSGFEGAPVQLTPQQQGQASIQLTAAFQITTVEFSPSFDISAIILSATSKTVSVQLPGAGGSAIENAPVFEITNVQLTGNGDVAMLQLNPVGARRA